MIPDRRPWMIRSNVPANGTDIFDRDIDYLRDPKEWVREAFRNDFPVTGVHMPGGRNRNLTTYDCSLFREPAAREAFFEQSSLRKGLRGTCLYVGRLHQDGTTMDVDNPTTRKFFREELAPYIEAGLTHLGVDAVSLIAATRASFRQLYRVGDMFGLRIVGEALPTEASSVDMLTLSSPWAHSAPWLCTSDFIRTFDHTDQGWGVDSSSDMQVWINDWDAKAGAYPNLDWMISFVRSLKFRRFTVGAYYKPRPEVVAEILK